MYVKNSPVSVGHYKDTHNRKSVPFFCLTVWNFCFVVEGPTGLHRFDGFMRPIATGTRKQMKRLSVNAM